MLLELFLSGVFLGFGSLKNPVCSAASMESVRYSVFTGPFFFASIFGLCLIFLVPPTPPRTVAPGDVKHTFSTLFLSWGYLALFI